MSANEMPPPLPKIFAGFWIRFAADVIDMIVLWILACALSIPLESWFMQLGQNGVWVGLLISIAYFVPLQSRFGNGQSLGKRLLKIQVLDLDGRPLSLGKSFVRYITIAFVAYAGIIMGIADLLPYASVSLAATFLLGVLWIVAAFGCYLLIPFHPLKRGLHDLLAGSVVVYRNRFDATVLAARNNPRKVRRAYIIASSAAALVLILGALGAVYLWNAAPIPSLLRIRTNLHATGKFRAISVSHNVFRNSNETVRSLIVQAHVNAPLSSKPEDLKPHYDQAFQTLRAEFGDVSQYQVLRVCLSTGYNLGIRSRYNTYMVDEDPANPGNRRFGGVHYSF